MTFNGKILVHFTRQIYAHKLCQYLNIQYNYLITKNTKHLC